MAKGEFVDHFQPCGFGLRTKLARAGQTSAGEDVLLNEISRAHIALEQGIVDHNALHTGVPAGFEQFGHGSEVCGPVFAAHSLHHFNGANGIKGCIVNVAVVLQAQVRTVVHAQAFHARLGKSQLFRAEGHTSQGGRKFGGCHFRERAPATANFQHTVAGLHLCFFQGPAYFGFLRLCHGLLQVAQEQRRRIVHGLIQPQPIKRVTQIVVGVDVLLAVDLGVAVEQMLDAVHEPPQPTAVNDIFHFLAVLHQHAQQLGQVGRAPVASDIALGEPDISRFERGGTDVPVVQVQRCVGQSVCAKALHGAIGKLQRQAAMADFFQ